MSIYDRISRALQKKWSRYGWGPKKFLLNVHHWHELYYWLTEHDYIVPQSWHLGKMQFLGTNLILKPKD